MWQCVFDSGVLRSIYTTDYKYTIDTYIISIEIYMYFSSAEHICNNSEIVSQI